MDLGISGKNAIICASSRGLGKACALALAEEGVNVVINGRNKDILEKTESEIKDICNVEVKSVLADITTPEGQSILLSSCEAPDILINNAGGPPPGDFHDWDRSDWISACEKNMFTPIELIKATIDNMIKKNFGRIVNITSSSVKAPIDILGLSNGARSGLTGFVAGIARNTIKNNVTINNILPGPFNTDRLRSAFEFISLNTGRSINDIKEERAASNPSGRFGEAEELGKMCSFICSIHTGYITGQNFLMDGGSYPGTY